MRGLFDIDSPLMQGLSRLGDLMLLNVLTVLLCIPIITAGAAFTAMHYVLIKLVRGEESYIVRQYFRAFKENFKKSTLIWLVFLVIIAVLGLDFSIIQSGAYTVPFWLLIILAITAVYAYAVFLYVFPLQAKFENTVRAQIKNAMLLSISKLPRTVAMILISISPVFLIWLSDKCMPLLFLFGISLPSMCNAYIYNGVLKKLEESVSPAEDDTETDEIIETSSENENIV